MSSLLPRVFLPFVLALGLVAAPFAATAQPVRVASKIDTEGALLGNMILQLLGAAGIPTENRLSLGATKIVRGALMTGEIDLYPEYTGNGAFFFGIDSEPVWRDAAAGYARIRELDREKNKLVWLKPAPANNTWAIAIRKDVAADGKLKTMEHLAAYLARGGTFKIAASAEFVESPAALPAFQKTYGFKLAPGQILTLAGGDTTVTIRAAAEETSGVNAAMAYGTDGALAALGLVVLDDTKGAQAVYEPAPVIRAEVLDRHPKIREILEPAFASLDGPTLQSLNARIAVEGIDARTVAADHLKAKGFLK